MNIRSTSRPGFGPRPRLGRRTGARQGHRMGYRLGAALVGALAASALLSGCVNNATFIDPQGPSARAESNLWWFIFIVALIVWAAVTAALLVSIVRFRARPGLAAPRQLHGNTTIEIIWTVVPSVILFLVLAGTIFTLFNIGEPPGATMTVRVVGHQWWWEFDYPTQGNIVTADELHIPVGQIVHIELVSNNVIHSFWVPQLAGKLDVIPGKTNTTWLKADTAGTYRGECAEYCGTQHAHMNFQVVADDPATFAAWLSTMQTTPPAPTGAAAAGQAVFNAHACYACHEIDQPGATPPASVPIAPNLTHIATRGLIAGGVLPNTADNLKKWITDNQDIKPGNDMNNQPVTGTDLDNLVAYLQSLK